MPTIPEFLAYYERERARHFEAAGWLFAGNGGVLVTCALFQEQLPWPRAVIALLSVGFVAAVLFLASVLILRRITGNPPHPASGLLIGLIVGSFAAGILVLMATLVLILIPLVW